MDLQVFKKKNVNWIRAINGKTLFKHCAENQTEVTMSKYTATVEALLFIHGVTCISKTRERKVGL
jgi:hypothetical protein